MYVYTYVHVNTCYVLTNPPIPYSPCDHIINLRPIFFYISTELTQGSSLVPTLKFIFFIFPSLCIEIFNFF
jgi:hypothetical protein